MVMLQPFS